MKINYNYLGDISEEFITPYVFKDSVATTDDLLAIKAPLDGEIRKVLADGKFYQYDKENDTWNAKTIHTSGSGSGDMAKSTYDTNNNGIVDGAEKLSDGTNTKTISDIEDIEIMALLNF